MAAERVSTTLRDHASTVQRKGLGDGNLHYDCNYCEETVAGTARFEAHLAGTKGACPDVPNDVREAFAASIAAKVADKKRKREQQEEQEQLRQRRLSNASAGEGAGARSGSGTTRASTGPVRARAVHTCPPLIRCCGA